MGLKSPIVTPYPTFCVATLVDPTTCEKVVNSRLVGYPPKVG